MGYYAAASASAESIRVPPGTHPLDQRIRLWPANARMATCAPTAHVGDHNICRGLECGLSGLLCSARPTSTSTASGSSTGSYPASGPATAYQRPPHSTCGALPELPRTFLKECFLRGDGPSGTGISRFRPVPAGPRAIRAIDPQKALSFSAEGLPPLFIHQATG
jgi:hypothetical protein